ncbi:MAG TPA: prepilin-type N-terminal cleavage/methylation domain-containing protein, partial [Gemmatimonadaceae bacterium]|nr:prepilin-type N-terminal cleavage/methylation domain-containing protein [Gemmatimonadaceae bacterium]
PSPPMPPRSRSAGFTLIELLRVVIIIGILAAIAIPKWQQTKGKANAAALRNDLHNLAVAEESYFYENQSYTSDINSLQIAVSQGVGITFVNVTPSGWSATATHLIASPTTCGIFVGSVAPPIAAASVEGRIGCQ